MADVFPGTWACIDHDSVIEKSGGQGKSKGKSSVWSALSDGKKSKSSQAAHSQKKSMSCNGGQTNDAESQSMRQWSGPPHEDTFSPEDAPVFDGFLVRFSSSQSIDCLAENTLHEETADWEDTTLVEETAREIKMSMSAMQLSARNEADADAYEKLDGMSSLVPFASRRSPSQKGLARRRSLSSEQLTLPAGRSATHKLHTSPVGSTPTLQKKMTVELLDALKRSFAAGANKAGLRDRGPPPTSSSGRSRAAPPALPIRNPLSMQEDSRTPSRPMSASPILPPGRSCTVEEDTDLYHVLEKDTDLYHVLEEDSNLYHVLEAGSHRTDGVEVSTARRRRRRSFSNSGKSMPWTAKKERSSEADYGKRKLAKAKPGLPLQKVLPLIGDSRETQSPSPDTPLSISTSPVQKILSSIGDPRDGRPSSCDGLLPSGPSRPVAVFPPGSSPPAIKLAKSRDMFDDLKYVRRRDGVSTPPVAFPLPGLKSDVNSNAFRLRDGVSVQPRSSPTSVLKSDVDSKSVRFSNDERPILPAGTSMSLPKSCVLSSSVRPLDGKSVLPIGVPAPVLKSRKQTNDTKEAFSLVQPGHELINPPSLPCLSELSKEVSRVRPGGGLCPSESVHQSQSSHVPGNHQAHLSQEFTSKDDSDGEFNFDAGWGQLSGKQRESAKSGVFGKRKDADSDSIHSEGDGFADLIGGASTFGVEDDGFGMNFADAGRGQALDSDSEDCMDWCDD